MPARPRPYRSLYWLNVRSESIPVFPLRGAFYLLATLLILGVTAFIVDRLLGRWAEQGKVLSQPWVAENILINQENSKKILNDIRNPVFRSQGIPAPVSKENRRRILVIGDSFIWGDGLSNLNMTWWRQLQWELERRGYGDVEVIAAGTNGASTQDQFRWLTEGRLLDLVQADAVVFGYVTNDPQMKDEAGNSLVKQMVPGASTANLHASVFGQAFPNLTFQIATRVAKKHEHAPNDEVGYPYSLWELKILEGENFARYKQLLRQVQAFMERSGIPMFFVTTPNAPNAESFEKRYAPVRPAFAEAGIELHDLLPTLLECCSATASGQLIWGTNPANGHPGARMTHFYASNVADILAKKIPHAIGSQSSGTTKYSPAINDWLPADLQPRQAGPTTWEVALPDDQTRLLRMPIEEPHFALNFERPVSMRSIRFHLKAETSVRFKVWAMVLEDAGNFESREYHLVGSSDGAGSVLALPDALRGRRITSLRIVPVATTTNVDALTLDTGKIVSIGGRAYSYPLPTYSAIADTLDNPGRSRIVVTEDGKPLAAPHALHEEIRKTGQGRYSHWQSDLIFSSSDGSDPRSNGRVYAIRNADGSATVRIDIDFNSPAVVL